MEEYFRSLPRSGWVWTGEPNAALAPDPQIVYFRKELTFDKLPAGFTADVSADSRYKLYVNGRLVETGPEKGDAKVWFYETADLLPYLTEGTNVLAAVVLRYPLTDRNGNHSIWRTERPGFFFKGKLTRADGSEETIPADETWRFRYADEIKIVGENPYFAPLQFFELAAGEAKAQGWKSAGFDDSDWRFAEPRYERTYPTAISPGNLQPRPIPSLYRKPARFAGVKAVREGANGAGEWTALLREDAPLTVPAESRAAVEITAGELMTGYISLALRGGAGAKVKLIYAESYAVEVGMGGMQLKKRDREDCENGVIVGYSDEYTVSGHGTEQSPEVYEPFWFRTFRFVRLEIETASELLTLAHLIYEETGYPLEVKTRVLTSDSTMEGIWDISVRTLRRCMHETYEDCPYYEQLQYIMDSRSQMLYTYNVAADDRLARKCMDDFKRSARYDGLLNCSYPCYGTNVIPGFSIYYILMLHDHMLYFGDKELIRYHLPTVDGILEYFRRNTDARGLVAKTGGPNNGGRFWSFIDWVDEWQTGVPNANAAGPITMESLLYIYGLDAAADIAEYVGRTSVAEEYRARAEETRRAVRAHCVGANGLYQDGPGFEEYSEHCQVFAVLTDTASPEEGKRILTEVTNVYAGGGKQYPRCSVAMMFYMFRALEKAGMYERTEHLWDLWRDMLRNNMTTCLESPDGRSDCHAWGSLALYELPATVLGVRPTAPGYASFEVKPVPGYFTHAEGEVVTPRGTVSVSWRLGADGLPDVKWELK